MRRAKVVEKASLRGLIIYPKVILKPPNCFSIVQPWRKIKYWYWQREDHMGGGAAASLYITL